MTKPKRHLNLRGKQERAADAKAANQREAEIAKSYLKAGPSIGNLARAAYHWYNSVPMLGGQDESGNILIMGDAPTPGMRNPKNIVNSASRVKGFITNPENLVKDFIKRNHSKTRYVRDIAEDIYGVNPNLQNVDYKAMNKYGSVFNERIKRTLPLAKARGTLRTYKEPSVYVADAEGRRRLYDTFINDTPTLKWDRTTHIGDPVTDKGKLAKDYYYKTRPAENVFDSKPSSFADRENNAIVLIPRGSYKNMYKYTLPHEKTHIYIDGRKEAELFGIDRGLGVRPNRPGDTDISLDLYLSRPDEQLARGTQIKNYLGIVDESPITSEQLKYAAQNYVKDTGYDNNMTDFFSTIEDYDKAAKWLSMAPLFAAPIIANRIKKKSGGKTNNSNNMPKYRIHLDEVKPYVIPTDNIQTVRPDTTDIEYPNFVFSRNNPNFGIYTGLGYNAYGEMIDYNNNGVPASQEYIIDKIKTKYYKNPSQRRVNNAKKAIGVRPDFKNGGSIHIDPSKKGTFTAAASKHNMSVQEFASRVLRNKENYSPAMVKKANFARNASKWH